jgi:hypothetical protein
MAGRYFARLSKVRDASVAGALVAGVVGSACGQRPQPDIGTL